MFTLQNVDTILLIVLSLGIILITAKFMGILTEKIGIPEVAGMIVTGLLLRFLPWFQNYGGTEPNEVFAETDKFISYMSEIGVILIMFSAGLSTNMKSLLKSGVKATVIALCGVLIPLILGTVMALCFWGFDGWGTPKFYKALFIGTILTATSVSISVAVLKELGKLSTEAGQTIVSAAIIDDVIGMIVLTIVLGISTGKGNIGIIFGKTILFFVCAFAAGFALFKLFKWYDGRHPHSHRMSIYALGVAFLFAFCAEQFFGIADITGAYIAGIIFCNLTDAEYMESKIDVSSYLFFSPIFFVSIGLKTDLSGMNMNLLWFAVAFTLLGCITKIIGCGGSARLLGFTGKESIQIGVGMMVRGEVALIVAQKGLSAGYVDPQDFTAVILLIIVSSMIVPVLLKKLFTDKNDKKKPNKTEPSVEKIN